jgi:hypothetical protein
MWATSVLPSIDGRQWKGCSGRGIRCASRDWLPLNTSSSAVMHTSTGEGAQAPKRFCTKRSPQDRMALVRHSRIVETELEERPESLEKRMNGYGTPCVCRLQNLIDHQNWSSHLACRTVTGPGSTLQVPVDIRTERQR